MLHSIVFMTLLNWFSPLWPVEMVREYEFYLCNMSGESVMAWEEGGSRVFGWCRLRLRMGPGERVRIVLGFRGEGTGAGIVRQNFAATSGRALGDVTLLHHRTFSYPAFIIDELYARASGHVSLGRGKEQSVVISLGRAGQQVLCLRSRRESELWFFF